MIDKIETEQQLEEALKRIDDLLDGSLSDEEQDELDHLSDLVEEYEDEHYPIPEISPLEMLKYLMEENELLVEDLSKQTGIEDLDKILSGKRKIDSSDAKKLADRFKMSEEIFLGNNGM